MDVSGNSNLCSPLSDGRSEPDLKNNVQVNFSVHLLNYTVLSYFVL